MKYKIRILGPMIVAAYMLMGNPVFAQPERNTDKTLSPYFFVKSDDPEVDQLPLKSTSVKVNISGVIADVSVTQVYKNEGTRPLEAIYLFPASTRAAVYGMKMTIGERTIIAKIRKREDARREYEQAKQEGKSASLLEQHRPNVFQMNVANILPGDFIAVELKYTELLVPTDAVYEFVFPTVVGPRYSEQKATDAGSGEEWVENPYLHQGESPMSTFHIAVNLSAGLPIQDLACASHQVSVDYEGLDYASVKLDPSERFGCNRDFVLKYRLSGGKIKTGLLLFEGKDENFFLLMLQPPKQVHEVHIPPREYIFIVDVSGSMHGFPLDISKNLLRSLIGGLRSTDRFNVLLFAGGSSVMSTKSVPATPPNISRAINMIDRQRGGGGTRLLPALKRALSLPKTEGFSRSVVIATDGYVSVEEEAFDLIRDNLGNANMFTFGIGSSVNRYIIEGMARVGTGAPFIITKPEEASEKAGKFRKLIQSPVLTGVKIDFGKFEVYDVEPPGIPDVLVDRPVIVFGKWRGRPKGNICLRGNTGDNVFMEKIDMTRVNPLEVNSALRYLWARHRIAILSDYNRLNQQDERVKEVINLGMTYNLMTAYTAFVAIDTRIRLKDGQAITVNQPLPLPQGVSDYAVGRRSFAGKGICGPAPSSTAVALKTKVMEESLEHKKEGHLDVKSATDKADVEGPPIQLKHISVTKGLSKDSIRKQIEKNMPVINDCYKQILRRQEKLKGKIVVTLIVDSEGQVIKVDANMGKKVIKRIAHCFDQKFMGLQFPAPESGGKGMVTLTFILK
jgi:Ca-activated chloride channel family protein